MDIIERARSSYSISITPVLKKKGEVWFCLDARKLHKQIIPDSEYPLDIDKLLTRFKKMKVISSLYFRCRYWQVHLGNKIKVPCSFLVNEINYSFKKMPFGLIKSGIEFKKCMDHVLGPIVHNFVTIYTDGIIIMSESLK